MKNIKILPARSEYWKSLWKEIEEKLKKRDYLWISFSIDDNFLTIEFYYDDWLESIQIHKSYVKKFVRLINDLNLCGRRLWLTTGIIQAWLTNKGLHWLWDQYEKLRKEAKL